jgi:hypothetical protein
VEGKVTPNHHGVVARTPGPGRSLAQREIPLAQAPVKRVWSHLGLVDSFCIAPQASIQRPHRSIWWALVLRRAACR